jgi:hypothetical protein
MFAAIINDHDPSLLSWPRPSDESDIKRLEDCFNIFENDLNVEMLLDYQDSGKESKSMMLQVQKIRVALKG